MLHFRPDGTFKIMQIADTQELPAVSPNTLELIEKALDREQPDLVIFTGDQIQGGASGFRRDPALAEQTIDQLAEPLHQRGIPFMVTYGNHDAQCGLSNTQQYSFYAKYPTFICGRPRSRTDLGTTDVQLYSSDRSRPVFQLYLFDSHGKDPDGEGYLPVTEEQLNWYRSERERLRKKAGDYLPSLVFQHIPVQEIYQVLQNVPRGTGGAVHAYGVQDGLYFVLPEALRTQGGFLGEFPAVPDRNTGEFAALTEAGEVLGIWCGHDHNNSFVGQYHGVDLGCTQGAGFHTYGPGRQRGVRIFLLHEEDLKHYESYTVTYNQISDRPVKAPLREFVYTHMPTSPRQVRATAVKAGLTTAGIVAGAGLLWSVYQISRWKRRKA